MTECKSPIEEKPKQYRSPAVRDNGRVTQLTKDSLNGSKGETFDITLIWST